MTSKNLSVRKLYKMYFVLFWSGIACHISHTVKHILVQRSLSGLGARDSVGHSGDYVGHTLGRSGQEGAG